MLRSVIQSLFALLAPVPSTIIEGPIIRYSGTISTEEAPCGCEVDRECTMMRRMHYSQSTKHNTTGLESVIRHSAAPHAARASHIQTSGTPSIISPFHLPSRSPPKRLKDGCYVGTPSWSAPTFPHLPAVIACLAMTQRVQRTATHDMTCTCCLLRLR